jgi:hypothetical protein
VSIYAFIAADLIAIAVLAYGLYYRRHRRREMVVALLSVNVGLMGVTYALTGTDITLGFGLGIFAVLSIIRLRSMVVDQYDIGYYFAAIALGILAGFPAHTPWVTYVLMAVVVAVIAVGDSSRLLQRARQQTVVLEQLVTDEAQAKAIVSELLGADIDRLIIRNTDVARARTTCDVRYRVRASA